MALEDNFKGAVGGKWKPGQSGNPSGRPKSKPFKEALAAILQDREKLEKAAAALVARAHTGDVAAIKEMADRMDGKIPQAIGGDPDGEPITVRWMKPGEDE